jgi:tetratricopeptide (TPR) repeat protein
LELSLFFSSARRLAALGVAFSLFPLSAQIRGTIRNPSNISPLLVTGKVRLEDGSIPPEPVKMDLMCGVTVIDYGYTNAKGEFGGRLNGQLGEEQGFSMNDPGNTLGTGGGLRRDQAAGGRHTVCDIRATMVGYSSGVVKTAAMGLDDVKRNVGTITLRRLGNTEGTPISITTNSAPDEARKAFEKARGAMATRRLPEAMKQYEKAVAAFPGFAAAWFELGGVYQQQKETAKATDAFQKSIAADAKFVKPYAALSRILYQSQNWAEASRISGELVRLDPVDFPDVCLIAAISNAYMGKFPEAEKAAAVGIQADTDHRFPQLYQVLAAVLVQKQDAAGALENLRAFLTHSPNSPEADKVRAQIADLEKQAPPKK